VPAVIWLLSGLLGGSPIDDMYTSSHTMLAKVQVKIALHDAGAEFENVVFHPAPGAGREGRSYACGYVRTSYNSRAAPRRFVFRFDTSEAVIQGSNAQLDFIIRDLCDQAPLPLALLVTGPDSISLKNTAPKPSPSTAAGESPKGAITAPPPASLVSSAQAPAIQLDQAAVTPIVVVVPLPRPRPKQPLRPNL
jgi:hypothetical protein